MRQRRPGEEDTGSRPQSDAVTEANVDENLNIGSVLLGAGTRFMKRNKKFTLAYVIGLTVLLFATGFAVSVEQQNLYNKGMSELHSEAPAYQKLRSEQNKLARFQAEYNRKRGWILCNRDCEMARDRVKWAQEGIADAKAEIYRIESKAKSHLGVFSEYSVQEARDLFWSTFAGGKEFAQRSSWFDLLFLSFDSMGRDEHIVAFLIRFIFQLVMNFTLGMIGAFFGFIYYLGDVVNSYQPGFIAGWVFYILAILGAFSVVVSFLVTLYFSAAGSVYVAAKAAGPNVLLQAGRPRQRIRYRRF